MPPAPSGPVTSYRPILVPVARGKGGAANYGCNGQSQCGADPESEAQSVA
jgi:hypothetical protein